MYLSRFLFNFVIDRTFQIFQCFVNANVKYNFVLIAIVFGNANLKMFISSFSEKSRQRAQVSLLDVLQKFTANTIKILHEVLVDF